MWLVLISSRVDTRAVGIDTESHCCPVTLTVRIVLTAAQLTDLAPEQKRPSLV